MDQEIVTTTDVKTTLTLSGTQNDLDMTKLFSELIDKIDRAADEETLSAIRARYMGMVTDLTLDAGVAAKWIYDLFDSQKSGGEQESTPSSRNTFQDQLKNEKFQYFKRIAEQAKRDLESEVKSYSAKRRRQNAIDTIQKLWGLKVVMKYNWLSQPIYFLHNLRKTAKQYPLWSVACRIFNRILLERMERSWEGDYETRMHPIQAKDLQTFHSGGEDHMLNHQPPEWFANDINWQEAHQDSTNNDDAFKRYGIRSHIIARFNLHFDGCNLIIAEWNRVSRHNLPATGPGSMTPEQHTQKEDPNTFLKKSTKAKRKANTTPDDNNGTTSTSKSARRSTERSVRNTSESYQINTPLDQPESADELAGSDKDIYGSEVESRSDNSSADENPGAEHIDGSSSDKEPINLSAYPTTPSPILIDPNLEAGPSSYRLKQPDDALAMRLTLLEQNLAEIYKREESLKEINQSLRLSLSGTNTQLTAAYDERRESETKIAWLQAMLDERDNRDETIARQNAMLEEHDQRDQRIMQLEALVLQRNAALAEGCRREGYLRACLDPEGTQLADALDKAERIQKRERDRFDWLNTEATAKDDELKRLEAIITKLKESIAALERTNLGYAAQIRALR